MENQIRTRPLQDITNATINTLHRLPILCDLTEIAKYEIAQTLRDYLKGRFADKENISDNCNWPYIAEGLKEMPLFCVMIEKHIDRLAQHIERELFPLQPNKSEK